MLSVEAARQRILDSIPTPVSVTVSTEAALGRVLSFPMTAPMDLPAFDNSAMDGYAVRAADVAGASEQTGVTLQLAGRCAAGEIFTSWVQAGECVRVFTGSPLPPGADAVVMQEDTRVEGAEARSIQVRDAVKPWEHVRFAGEDVKRGAVIGAAGDRVGVGQLGLFAALGIGSVAVSRAPTVGLLATGSELRAPGEALGPGQIYESNRIGLAALVRRWGGVPAVLPLVPDSLAATRDSLERAFAENDLVLTTGGVSVGEHDFVKAAFADLGGELEVWRVAIKPGKPFAFGRWRGKFLFGLPGNPVSALVTFCVLVAPALARMQGAAEVELPCSFGVLGEPLVNRGDRRHFLRVRMDSSGRVVSAGTQASHILSAMAQANGLVEVPPETVWETGRSVRVLRWE